MALQKEECLGLLQKLSFGQEQVIKVWRRERIIKDSPEKNRVKKFLVAYCPTINLSFLFQGQARKCFQSFLDEISDKYISEQLTKEVYDDSIKQLRKKFYKLGKWQNLHEPKNHPFQNLQAREKKEQVINGKQIQIRIVLNSKRMNPDYSIKEHKLKKLFTEFVHAQIVQTLIKAPSQKKVNSVRILDCKYQFKDSYTGSYVFDPFFNSVKIVIKKKDNSDFQGNFTVKDPNDIKVTFQDNTQDAYWADESNFQLSDNVGILIDYICEKENADFSTKRKLKEDLREQGFFTIKDLMFNTKQSIDKVIFKKKWANEILSEVDKIRAATRKPFTGNENISEQKKECRRMGNSHKILRYLFFKVGTRKGASIMEDEFIQKLRSEKSLKELNSAIPKINAQLMKTVIKIAEKQLMIEDLFPQLQRYFKYFTEIPDAKQAAKFQHPYGVLFYGPPGTGKTRLTEDLAELMGFHLVSHGLSSAQFMKELVGQAKGTVHSYLRRAQVSKHLICSLAIDQIDAIVGDRRKQNSKSQETVAMFLSALGGNQAIENILVFGSTNFRNLIDDAILRRLTPDFYVRLPSKEDRKKIVKSLLPSLQKDEATLQFIASITPNYSGAAMKLLCQKYSLYKQERALSQSEWIKIAAQVAVSYKIKFGDETYPQLYERIEKKISLEFIQNTFNKVLLIQKLQSNKFRVLYSRQQKQWKGNKLESFVELRHADVRLIEQVDYQSTTCWILDSLASFQKQQNQPQIIQCNFYELGQKILTVKQNKYTIFIVKGVEEKKLEKIAFTIKNPKLVSVIFYVEGITHKSIVDCFGKLIYENKAETGRVIVDLTSSQPSMVFELKKSENYPNQIEKRPFFQNKSVQLPKDTLPQIVQFLMEKQVQYIQMINSQLLHDNNAFVENDIHTVITSKIDEAKQYSKSSIIIDLSSLIHVTKNVSEAQTGNTISKNISQPTLYHKLVELIKNFATLEQKKIERWIFVIVEDADLLDMLKKDIKLASSPQQMKQQFDKAQNEKSEKLKKQLRVCLACSQFYTHEENQKQKSCKQHYGLFVDEQECELIGNESITIQQIRFIEKEKNIGVKQDKNKHKFVYSCCWKDIDSEGCKYFQHWGGFVFQEKIEHPTKLRGQVYRSGIWKNQCKQLRETFKNYLKK